MSAFEHVADDVDIARGDCLEVMSELPDACVDMVLTDLPYGTTRNSWDCVLDLDALWTCYKRVCKRNAAILLFSQQPFTTTLISSNMKQFRYEWTYEKTNASGFLNARKMPMKCHESVCVFYDALPTFNPQFEQGEAYEKDCPNYSVNYGKMLDMRHRAYGDKRYPRDLLRFHNASWGYDKGLHPTQKPVALCEYMVRTYTNMGDVVLDSTMGSGTTGVACINTGRKFVGIELDEGYYQIARQRLMDTAAQGRLFMPED